MGKRRHTLRPGFPLPAIFSARLIEGAVTCTCDVSVPSRISTVTHIIWCSLYFASPLRLPERPGARSTGNFASKDSARPGRSASSERRIGGWRSVVRRNSATRQRAWFLYPSAVSPCSEGDHRADRPREGGVGYGEGDHSRQRLPMGESSPGTYCLGGPGGTRLGHKPRALSNSSEARRPRKTTLCIRETG